MTYEIIKVTTERTPYGKTTILAQAIDINNTLVEIVYFYNDLMQLNRKSIKIMLDKEYNRLMSNKPEFGVNVGDVL